MESIKVMQVGLWPIVQKAVQYMVERKGIEIVLAVAPAADKACRDLADLCSVDNGLGITVCPDVASAMMQRRRIMLRCWAQV